MKKARRGCACPSVSPFLDPPPVESDREPNPPVPTPIEAPSATLLAAPSSWAPAASENWIGSDSKCGRSTRKRFTEKLNRDTAYVDSADRWSVYPVPQNFLASTLFLRDVHVLCAYQNILVTLRTQKVSLVSEKTRRQINFLQLSQRNI